MSSPNENQHQFHLLKISQSEEPTIDCHCLAPVTSREPKSSSVHSTCCSKSDTSDSSRLSDTTQAVKISESDDACLNSSDKVIVESNEIKLNTNEIINCDEQIVQCEIAINSQDDQIDESNALIIDESVSNEGQLKCSNMLTIASDSLLKSDQFKNSDSSRLAENESNSMELNSQKSNLNESNSEIFELNGKSCTTFDRQQSDTLNELSEDYRLNCSGNNAPTTIVNKPTLNINHYTQTSTLTNKRKTDSSHLHILACRKSARIHESQSYHSDNSIYLFETLRKRSSSISSTNSSTHSTDLSRSAGIDKRKTKEIHFSDLEPVKRASTSINLSSVKFRYLEEKKRRRRDVQEIINDMMHTYNDLLNVYNHPAELQAYMLSNELTELKRKCPNSEDPIMDDCTAALVLMSIGKSLSCSSKSVLFKDKLEKFIRKESTKHFQVPDRSTTSRIAMLPKQRYKQEARLMLLNADLFVDTYLHKQQANSASKRISNSQSTEEGYEEFTSFSEEDDELFLRHTAQVDNEKPHLTTQTQLNLSANRMKCNAILKPVARMVFQCTWRSCGHECDIREQMEEHVRIKHLGLTSCTDDHEEDFYYTEVELDSPLDSSGVSTGVSSAGQSPMHDLSNNSKCFSATTSMINRHNNTSSPTPIIKQASRKRGPRSRTKNLIESSADHFTNCRLNSAIATWMSEHMDMAKPPHEDPEYLSTMNGSNNITSHSTNNQTTVIKRERKRAASNSNYYASDQSDFEPFSQQQQQYLQNLTAEQLIKLQQQNNLHLKNNIQHLQQLHRQTQHLHQLHQLHQYNNQQQVKRKYTKSQQNSGNTGSILMSTTRTKSVICSMVQLESELDHRVLNSSLSPNPLKRSKPIKIPGVSLAHREASYQSANQSPSFTVGSVQLSPTGYFHCFSPTPPHSLSSPTSSNSSMYSLGSCNSPGSSSIASSSSNSPNGQSSFNRNSAHYSPIDTLLQTVENERMQQQLAMKDESSVSSITSTNPNSSISGGRKISKLRSANVSDLDLVAQNEDEEDTFNRQSLKKTLSAVNNSKRIEDIEDKNELLNQKLETIKCTNNSQLITNHNPINKKTLSSVIIRNGHHDASLAESLTVDCDVDYRNKLNANSLIDLQTKQQQLVQTAQQALVTLASTASNLCNSSTNQLQNTTSSINQLSSQTIEKSNSIQNNSTNSSQINTNKMSDAKNSINQQKSRKDGLLMASNLIQSAAGQSEQHKIADQQPFNYLVSHSGRTIKPTPAAKSYVQRKHRITKFMRTQNSTSTNSGKQNGISKSKNSNLIQFERLIEAVHSNNIQTTENNTSTELNVNMARHSIISSVNSLNNGVSNRNHNNQNTIQTQALPSVQRTPTGRIRNSGAKCRKKFGMENKEKWCVQCRWKKACSRVESNNGLNLTQYNNNNQAGSTEVRNRGRPSGRPANNSSNNSDQRRAVAQAIQATSSRPAAEQNQHDNMNNATGDFSAIAEEMLFTGTLLNDQRTVVSAK